MSRDNKTRKRYLFQCDNKQLKKILIALWSVAFSLEALVISEIWVGIQLSDDYLNEVFSATCTVAVLGNAILSILFGVYDKKTLGVPFQDVLNHSRVGSEQRFTIQVLTGSIIFAVMWYVLGCYNLLFSVLIQNVFLLLFSCEDLWRFLSDKEKQKNTITEIIMDVEPSRYAIYVDNWFKDLRDALVPNNEVEVDEYCSLFELVIKTSPESEAQIRSCIARHLQVYFDMACDKLGFVEAFSLLRKVVRYAPKSEWLSTDIALKYLEKLKTHELVDVVNCKIVDLVEQIFEDEHFDDEEKAAYAYNYFCAVFDNVYMNTARKLKQTQEFLYFCCDLQENSFGLIKAKVITNIVKYKIIDNDDIEGRKRLFFLLVESLNKRMYLTSDKYYIATIAEIYRAFYFTIYLEDSSLKESYRQELLALFQSPTNEKDCNPLFFMTLVYRSIDDVVKWLVMDAAGFGEMPKLFWEYYGSVNNWKRIVWTRDEVTAFAFHVYYLLGQNMDENPFVTILESDEYTTAEKLAVCKNVLAQCGNMEKGGLVERRIRQISELSKINGGNLTTFWEPDYTYYQEKTIELMTAVNQEAYSSAKLKSAEVWERVQGRYKESCLFQFDSDVSIFPGVRYTFPPTFEVLHERFWENASNRVEERLWEYFNCYVEEILPQVPVGFKLPGVDALLNVLDGEVYQYRNYKYTDDCSFGPTLRSSPEFKRLSSLLSAIPCDNKSRLKGRYFLKKARIPFNFYLQYELENLSTDQCHQYVTRYEKYGKYVIDGYCFDYDHAMNYVERNVLLEKVTIFIHIDIQADDGFRIQLIRR